MSKRSIAVLLAGAALAAGTFVGVGSAGAAEEPDTAVCDKGHWPVQVDGQPVGFHAGSPTGLYTWHDSDGWHLRVTHPTQDRLFFTGRVSSDAEVHSVRVRDERNDFTRYGRAHRAVEFSLANYGGVDGIDFRTRCGSYVRINLAIGRQQARPDQVFIGHDRHHPGAVPVTITREP